MTPRAVIAWSTASLIAVIADTNPITRAFILLAALNVVVQTARPGTFSVRSLRFVVAGMVVATIISTLLDHTGSDVLFTVPNVVPAMGGNITLEALGFGLATGIGLGAGMIAVLPLATQLDPSDILDSMPRRLHRTGLVVASALALLPRIRRASQAILEAQSMRGYQAHKLRRAGDIVVPVVMASVEESFVMAQAMQARGFGSGPRTRLHNHTARRADVASIGAAWTAAGLLVVAHLAGWTQDWFPFPKWSVPPLETAGLLAAALIAVPAFFGRHDPG